MSRHTPLQLRVHVNMIMHRSHTDRVQPTACYRLPVHIVLYAVALRNNHNNAPFQEHHTQRHSLCVFLHYHAPISTLHQHAEAIPCGLLLQVVSLHCALNKDTTHLINKERLQLMKEDALIINASRGPVINETDLVEHLQQHPNFR